MIRAILLVVLSALPAAAVERSIAVVSGSEIGALAVDTTKINPDAVTNTKLLNDSASLSKVTNGLESASSNAGIVVSTNETITSTLTVQGNAFSVGGATLSVSGGNVVIYGTSTFGGGASSTTFLGPVLMGATVGESTGTYGLAGSSATFQGPVVVSTGYQINGVSNTAQNKSAFEVVGVSSTSYLKIGALGDVSNPSLAFPGTAGVYNNGLYLSGGSIVATIGGASIVAIGGAGLSGGSGTAGVAKIGITADSLTSTGHQFASDAATGLTHRTTQGYAALTSSAAQVMTWQSSGSTTPATVAITFPSGIITPGNLTATTVSSVSIQGTLNVGVVAGVTGATLQVSSAPSGSQNVILANGVVPGSPGVATTGTLAQGTVTSCATGSQVSSTGAFTTCVASDVTLKREIKPLVYSPNLIDALRPVTYRWKDPAARGYGEKTGFIAQEVGQALPDAVIPAGGKLKGIDPMAVSAALVKEVQALRRRVEQLERAQGRK